MPISAAMRASVRCSGTTCGSCRRSTSLASQPLSSQSVSWPATPWACSSLGRATEKTSAWTPPLRSRPRRASWQSDCGSVSDPAGKARPRPWQDHRIGRSVCFVNWQELNVKTIVGLFAAAALVGLATSATAQPPGSYRDSCRDIRMQGSVLTALCRRAGGRGEQRSALNVEHCVGDIGNNNGNLVCNGGQPVSPPPSAGYPSGPGYPAQGYGPQPGSGYPSGPGYPAQGYGPPPR